MADPRKDDGTGVIVLQNPDDPVPQPMILLPDGSSISAADLAGMSDDEVAALTDDDLRADYEAAESDDVSDLDDDLPEEDDHL